MTIADAKLVHQYFAHDQWVGGANFVLDKLGRTKIDSEPKAKKLAQGLFQHLLDADNYLEAATLQWGPNVFLAEPESVVRSFNAVHESSKLLVIGGSSLGKTYGIGAYMTLDYLRDPLYTSVKLAAVSEKHLKENLYPHVAKLIRSCVIPCQHKIEFKESDLWMGIKEAGFEFGISGIAFKQSQETSGQFKGYKFLPVRRKPHPRFGYTSRLRVLGDECQNWPGGPFQDFNSLMASISGTDRIKIALAFNPENTACKVVQMAEPDQGWLVEEVDTLYDYTSKIGWRVCRLDAAKCENVIQKKVVYDGLQTYEGYLSYLKAGGDNSPNYWCFARGFPPMVGLVNTIIPPQWPQSQRGEATFIENPESFASVDLAFMGKDTAQMAVGRWGLASGWKDHQGVFHTFKSRTDIAKGQPRHVLQIDNILPLAKHDNTVTMAEEIIGRCKALQIKPTNVAIDRTGYGFGVHGHLTKVWGDVFGVSWNEKPTERKILSEDRDGAEKQCDGVMSEMWWAFRRWLEPSCCAVLINPIIPPQPIHTQLTARRYKTGKNGIKVEPKEEYMSRNGGISPDEADACFVAGTLVRTPKGDVPIETLRVGDLVETPFGPTTIGIFRENLATDMAWLNTSDGAVINGTARHKFFTWDRGWVRMDELCLTNQLESVCNLGVWKSLNLLFTTERPIGFKQLVDITKMTIKKRPRDFYIEPFGSSTSDLYHWASTYITKTKTGQTTTQTTSSCSHQPNTPNTTGKRLGSLMRSGLQKLRQAGRKLFSLPQRGTPHQKDSLGTPKTEVQLGKTDKSSPSTVSCVDANSLPHSQQEHLSVQQAALIKGHTKKCPRRKGSALFAKAYSFLRKDIRQRPVPLSVVRYKATEPVKVYNLTLTDHNAYYANGVLVQNCVMLVHVVRKVSDVIPGLVEQQSPPRDNKGRNEYQFESASKMVSLEVDDSIALSSKEEY